MTLVGRSRWRCSRAISPVHMALRRLSRFIGTILLAVSLLGVTNRALSVTFEQVCQGLEDVISNANSEVLSMCSRDNNCTMVLCQVSDSIATASIIHQSALTILPCEDLPAVRLQLWDPSMDILLDQVFSETRRTIVNTSLGPLPLTVFLNRTMNTVIGVKIEYSMPVLMTVQTVTLINFTSIPVDTSICVTDGSTPFVEATGSASQGGVPTTMSLAAVDTTPSFQSSPTSNGTATKFTSTILALTVCLLIVHTILFLDL